MNTLGLDEKSKPMIHLDVEGKDTKQLDGVKPGADVRLVITGKACSVSLRDDKSGTLGVEIATLKVTASDDGLDALNDDEDD